MFINDTTDNTPNLTPNDINIADNTDIVERHDEDLNAETEDNNSHDGTDDISDEVEVEFEGEHYKLPKNLKDALMRQADYTKKTTEVAETRKQLEAKEQEVLTRTQTFQKDAETFQKYQNQLMEISVVDDHIRIMSEQVSNLIEDYPQEAMKLQIQLENYKGKRAAIIADVQAKEQQYAYDQQQKIAKLEQESTAELSRDIKGWNTDLKDKLVDYASKLGISKELIGETLRYHPKQAKIVYKAYLYDQLKQQSSSKQAQPPVVPKPVSKVSSGASTDLKYREGMSQDDYLKWRALRKSKNQK